MTTANKRGHHRVGSLNLLSYACMDKDNNVVKQGMGRTLNVSQNGILLETHIPLDPDWAISLAIGLEDKLVDVHGRVVRSRRNEAGEFECGIEFQETDERALQILHEYMTAFNDIFALKGL